MQNAEFRMRTLFASANRAAPSAHLTPVLRIRSVCILLSAFCIT